MENKSKKPKHRKRIKISKATIYTIGIVILIFIAWQFLLVPFLTRSLRVPPVGQIPPVKRGDIKFVNEQLTKRVLKNVPPLTPPKDEIGKENPFD